MIFAAIVTLLAVSANAYYPTSPIRPEILLAKWTPKDIYSLNKICELVEKEKYRTPYENIYETSEKYENLYTDKLTSRKNIREMEHCCNKYTITEKKQCLKEVRENYLDVYCDRALDHTCCKTEYEQRYLCFAKNPFFRGTSTLSPLEIVEDSWMPTSRRFNAEPRSLRQEQRLLNELSLEEQLEEQRLTNDYSDERERFSYLEKMDDIRGIFKPIRNVEQLEEELYEEEKMEQKRGGWTRDVEEMLYEQVESPLRKLSSPYGRRPWENRFESQSLDTLETLKTLEDVERKCQTPGCRLESEMQVENEFFREKVIDTERPCQESHQCRRHVEVATRAAAEQVCANKMFKGGHRQVESCCRAGSLVGKTVGRKNVEVCVPALFKFQAKTHGCVYNKPECKQAFVECCHERAQEARNERFVEKEAIRGNWVREDIMVEEPTVYQRRQPWF